MKKVWNQFFNRLLSNPEMPAQPKQKAFSVDTQNEDGGRVRRMLELSELRASKPMAEAKSMLDKTKEPPVQRMARGSKLKMSIEKKIENIWLESEELGWSYNDFVSHLLEVVIVLNYRSFLPKLDANQNGFEKARAP